MNRLSRTVQVGYGAGSLGIAATEFFVRVYLLKLYTGVLGLPAWLAGTVLAAALVWDAITDPLIGELSDRTRARSGRRRPWIAAGSLLAAFGFAALFSPPNLGSSAALAVYLLIAYIAFNTALTVLAVPHAALGGELTSDPTARNRLFGWRFLFANLGLLAGILLPVAAGALWLAPLVTVGGLAAFLATRGRDAPDRTSKRPSLRSVLSSVRAVLRGRPFRPLLLAYVLGSIALTINSALALFYYEHRLHLGEREVFLGILLPFALIIALSIGGWVLLTRRTSKRATAFFGILLLGIGTSIVYPLLPAGSLVGPVIWAILGGMLVGSVFLLDSTVADMANLDEALTGEQREGLYFGFWRLGSKLARALGLVVSGFLLDAVGFVPGATEQPKSAVLGIALVFGPGVGILYVSAAFLWLLVPVSERIQERVRKIIARRAARSRPDPAVALAPSSPGT